LSDSIKDYLAAIGIDSLEIQFTSPNAEVASLWASESPKAEGIKFDQNKRRVDLVPTEAINALADVLTAGAVKYGEHNWRHGMDWSRVYGAAQRHMLAFWGGDDIDEESGMPHLWHALTNMAFLVSYQALSVGRDDRWKQEGDE
jgi:hypothetical protein